MEETLATTDSCQATVVEQLAQMDPTELSVSKFQGLWDQLITSGVDLGKHILAAIVIYFLGKWLIKLIKKVVNKMLTKRNMDEGVKTFIASLVNVSLTVLLLIAVIGALGIETTSFAALLASAGVAIGMALSGQLSNFAGGLMILVFKPYKVGDFIEAQGQTGTVKAIQLFQTILLTTDNKTVIIPNGSISSGIMTNYSAQELRRVDFSFAVEYGTDYEKVQETLNRIIASNSSILKDPAPFIELGALAESSVNVTVRVWCSGADYWSVYFWMNKTVYETFNKEGIAFPFPQLTVHQG